MPGDAPLLRAACGGPRSAKYRPAAWRVGTDIRGRLEVHTGGITMKRASTTAIGVAAVLMVLCAGAQAQDAIRQPGQKQIGKVKPEVEPALIVMNSAGAKLEGNKLVLTGIAPNSIIFADRPVRAAGHALTAHLLEEWAVGSDSFGKDPPNATVSAFDN